MSEGVGEGARTGKRGGAGWAGQGGWLANYFVIAAIYFGTHRRRHLAGGYCCVSFLRQASLILFPSLPAACRPAPTPSDMLLHPELDAATPPPAALTLLALLSLHGEEL